MSKSEVVTLLGEPGFVHANSSGLSWTNYGCYELLYFDGKLTGIQNDHLQADCSNHGDLIGYENSCFRIDTWFLQPGRDISLRELRILLTTEGIAFEEVLRDDYTLFRFESRVEFDFANHTTQVNPEDCKLNGIRFQQW